MLRLNKITKEYQAGTEKVLALNSVSVSFRKNEFVSILGHSGSGKTTMLNIIGGLDKYTSGDLIICGKSTKEYKSRDWDLYRNQRIGFIFQAYNLIPHQSVLANVELALTITGIKDKHEIRRRAMEALDKVGLSNQYKKKPNQLSGGQCQRVAIARALVNNPEILLADEPTGALDTKTSEQIMDLIKEISKDKLVIMVTHNPEIAEKYSSRIISLKDGEIISDTKPFSEEDEIEEVKQMDEETRNKVSKAKMSLPTAFKLSAKNLWSKRKRTSLVAVAGSIGIIGISCVLSISTGIKHYIDGMQDDLLSGNPIQVSETSLDYESLMTSMSNSSRVEFIKEEGYVNVDSVVEFLISRSQSLQNAYINNDLSQDYIDYISEMDSEIIAAMLYDYGLDVTNNFYVDFKISESREKEVVSMSALKNTYVSLLKQTEFAEYSSMLNTLSDPVMVAPNSESYIRSQYDVIGEVATKADEIMIVVDKNSTLTDISLAEMGLYSQDEFLDLAYKGLNDPKYDEAIYKTKFSNEELMNLKVKYYPNDSIYVKNVNPVTKNFSPFNYQPYDDGTLEDGLELHVTGILSPKSSINYGCLTRGFYYTQALCDKLISDNKESEIVLALKQRAIDNAGEDGTPETNPQFTSGNYQLGEDTVVATGITYQYHFEYDEVVKTETGFVGQTNALSSLLGSMLGGTQSTYYFLSLRNLGGVDIPEKISLYPVNFDAKDKVVEYLQKWNSDEDITLRAGTSEEKVIHADEREEIKHTDTLSLILAMINQMIDIVTTALIAFTALSLVVSCVMIAVITYISVVERVKEIGVIRSLGGRKSDVSNLFVVETLIIGFFSGLIGVLFTYVFTAVINVITVSLNVGSIALFPILTALIMIGLSILLTIVSGFIPSRKASKQDPVQALRSE